MGNKTSKANLHTTTKPSSNVTATETTAKWMTIEEQQRQIAMGIERERRRILAATLDHEIRASESRESAQETAIRQLVDKYLKNDLVNNPFIPDFLERKIYNNLLKLVIGIMRETAESISIDVMGQRVTIKIEAIPEPVHDMMT